jgi:phosphoglycolate phosphatase-like HAD superfamily hydrolase
MYLMLFDIDGTLVNVRGSGRRALTRAFLETFPVPPQRQAALENVYYAGSSDPRILADMAHAVGVAERDLALARPGIEERYVRHLRETVAETPDKRACPGVAPLLERMAGRANVTLGLITGNIEAGARIKLEPFGLNRFFAFGGFGGDSVERSAIAARAVERAAARAGAAFAPQDVALIGDTVHDVAAGRAHGYLTVAVGTGWERLDALRDAGADGVFPDLTPEHGFEEWLMERWPALDGAPR